MARLTYSELADLLEGIAQLARTGLSLEGDIHYEIPAEGGPGVDVVASFGPRTDTPGRLAVQIGGD